MKQFISLIQVLVLEFFPRFFSDNPKFFKAIQLVALVAGLVVKAPDFLIAAGFDVHVLVQAPYSSVIAVCATIVAILAQLPNINPVTSKTDVVAAPVAVV